VHAPHRRLLLELYRAIQPAVPAARAAAVRACANAWGLALTLEQAAAPAPALRLAVGVVHELEARATPLCVRLGPLVAEAAADPVLCAALAAAPLIAGRAGRAVLAVALDGRLDPAPPGALVDAETCARIALGGGELESGRHAALELLELAGDLVTPLPSAHPPALPGAVLLAALRLDPAEAARCLGRAAPITMPDIDL
jgi:hypothetical protein